MSRSRTRLCDFDAATAHRRGRSQNPAAVHGEVRVKPTPRHRRNQQQGYGKISPARRRRDHKTTKETPYPQQYSGYTPVTTPRQWSIFSSAANASAWALSSFMHWMNSGVISPLRIDRIMSVSYTTSSSPNE